MTTTDDVSTQSANGHGQHVPAVYRPQVGEVFHATDPWDRARIAVAVRAVADADTAVRAWVAPADTDGTDGTLGVLNLSAIGAQITDLTAAHRTLIATGLVAELGNLRQSVGLLDTSLATVREIADRHHEALLTQREALESYKARVRAEALRVKVEQGWCNDGTNATLRNLGLDEIEEGFTAEVVVTREIRVRATVRVDNTDDIRRARNWLHSELYVDTDGGLDSHDSDLEIVDVETADDATAVEVESLTRRDEQYAQACGYQD